MNKALIVAKWEFVSTVTRRAYIFAVVGMPLLYGAIFGVSALAGRSAAVSANRVPTVIVDRAAILDLGFASALSSRRDHSRGAAAAPRAAEPPAALIAATDLDAALDDLKNRRVAAVYVVEADYLTSGNITVYGRGAGLFNQPGSGQRAAQVSDAIRASLIRSGLSGDALDRAFAPATRLKRMRVDDQGRIQDQSGTSPLGVFSG
jgi:hypothetical protein